MAISVLAVTELGDPVGQQFQRSETAERMHAFVQADSADAAVILYTSGTTGFAKGATLSHGNVRSTVHAFNHLCHLEPRDRILLSVPLFHCYGQNALLNSGLNVGATIVLQRRFDLQESKQLIVEERVSKLFSVPTSFQLLHDYCQPSDLKSVGYCFSAAATLPIQLGRRWQEKFGMPIYEGYGLTETAPFASYNHRLKHVPGSIGTPVDNVEMKIIDLESGQTCPPGKLGEIAIRGPNVMLGYWNRPRATAEVMRDGWFCSGDIGRMDERGYFFIVDRVKDMISIGGMKVYPAEVERVLLDHPAVREAAVVGFPDEVFGEKPVAFIVFNDSMRHDVDQLQPELKAVCHSSLADFKVPKHFVFVDELPRNPAGKILKTELREMEVPSSGMSTDAGLLANEQADVSESVREESGLPEISHGDSSAWLPRAAQLHPATWQREIEVLIQEELSSILAAERVPGLNERFVELGLDSMALVDLRDRLQWHFGTELELPATLVFDYPRICDLALYLAESLRASKQVERGPTEQEAESVAVEECPPPPSSADSEHHAQQLEEQDIASLSEAEALDALLRELQD